MYRIVLLLALLAFSASAKSVLQAYKEFYDSPEISSNHCGVNIQKFLQYLKDEGVKYNSGYVVSIHEDFAALNHFDARWGSRSYYENGDEYFRSNWYFHVFAVIDGKAYDFSQRGPKAQRLKDYLNTAYIPKSKTENIFFLGRYTKEKALKKYQNMEMNVYNAETYRRKTGDAKYSGVFIELFHIDNKKFRGNYKPGEVGPNRIYSKRKYNSNGSVTYTRPMLNTEEGAYPMLAYSEKICQAFGHFGAMPGEVELEITDKKTALYLYTTIREKEFPYVNPNEDISVSFESRETMGSVPRYHFHYAKSVTCANLEDIINSI
jgi:hypothetical protein